MGGLGVDNGVCVCERERFQACVCVCVWCRRPELGLAARRLVLGVGIVVWLPRRELVGRRGVVDGVGVVSVVVLVVGGGCWYGVLAVIVTEASRAGTFSPAAECTNAGPRPRRSRRDTVACILRGAIVFFVGRGVWILVAQVAQELSCRYSRLAES